MKTLDLFVHPTPISSCFFFSVGLIIITFLFFGIDLTSAKSFIPPGFGVAAHFIIHDPSFFPSLL